MVCWKEPLRVMVRAEPVEPVRGLIMVWWLRKGLACDG